METIKYSKSMNYPIPNTEVLLYPEDMKQQIKFLTQDTLDEDFKGESNE